MISYNRSATAMCLKIRDRLKVSEESERVAMTCALGSELQRLAGYR
jgi:hypothetical protein